MVSSSRKGERGFSSFNNSADAARKSSLYDFLMGLSTFSGSLFRNARGKLIFISKMYRVNVYVLLNSLNSLFLAAEI